MDMPKLEILVTKDGLPHILACSPDWTKEKATEAIRRVEAHEGLVKKLEEVFVWFEKNSCAGTYRMYQEVKQALKDEPK